MKDSKYSDTQIVSILKEAEDGQSIAIRTYSLIVAFPCKMTRFR